MNIFEDLIDELKEENLIEQTVIETSRAEEAEASENRRVEAESESANKADNSSAVQESPQPENPSAEDFSHPEETNQATATEEFSFEPIENSAETASEKVVEPTINESEFYRQKATEEVSFLQMVEAVFAGIEREQLKVVPRPFDDLSVKKVLHSFLQVSNDANSPEYSAAEFQLLRETESWYSSLSLRDMRIMTAHLRRYCETSRPPLSSPALVALARFYRNSPFTEQIRSKFDLVVTRLFSKEIGANQREMVFSREELFTHLSELYADWSSVPLYSTEENDGEISQAAQEFENFTAEAEAAESFDELINGNFFNRLRIFKESCHEDFYAPAVAAAGIECNIRVGNRYVELLEQEKVTGNIADLESRYGLSHDQAISEATGKTLALAELLKQKTAPPKTIEEKNIVVIEPIAKTPTKKPEKVKEKQSDGAIKSKKWILSIAAIATIIIAAIYFAAG